MKEARRSGTLVAALTGLAFLASWAAIYRLFDNRDELLLRQTDLVRRNDELDEDLAKAHALVERTRAELSTNANEKAALADSAKELAIAARRTNAMRLQAAEIAIEASRLARAQALLTSVPEEARGLSWKLLQSSLQRRFPLLVDAEDDILALATAPGQTEIAVGTREGRLLGYAVVPPEHPVAGSIAPLFEIEAHEEAIFACAFDPAGKRLAAGDLSGQVSVWDIASGDDVASCDFDETVTALGFVDETHLVIGGDDGRLGVWNTQTAHLSELRGHDRSINAIEIDTERRRFASASDDALVRLWSGSAFETLIELEGHGDWVRDVAFAPDGVTLASASSDLTIRHWDTNSGQELRSSSTQGVEVVGFEYASDGSGWCAYGRFGELLFERAGARLEYDVPLVGGIAVLGGTSARDLSWLSLAMGGALSLWCVNPAPNFRERQADMGELRRLATSSNGNRVVAAGTDGGVWLFEAEEVQRIGGHRGSCMAVALSVDGNSCASGGRDGKARVFDLAPQVRERLVLDVDDNPVVAVAFSPDASRVACVSRIGLMRSFDTTSGKLLREIPPPRKGIAVATLDANAKLLAWIGDGGTIRTWDVVTGERVHPLRDRELGRVAALDLAENGLRLACSNNDSSAHVYDLETKERICVVTDPDLSIWSLAIDALGETLATASRDGVIQLWDVESGERLVRLRGRHEAILSLAFRRDGKALYAGTDGGRLEIFEVELE